MPKTDVRENAAFLGDLIRDFNFSQAPRPRLILNPCPAQTTLIPKPKPSCNGSVALHTNTWGDS